MMYSYVGLYLQLLKLPTTPRDRTSEVGIKRDQAHQVVSDS